MTVFISVVSVMSVAFARRRTGAFGWVVGRADGLTASTVHLQIERHRQHHDSCAGRARACQRRRGTLSLTRPAGEVCSAMRPFSGRPNAEGETRARLPPVRPPAGWSKRRTPLRPRGVQVWEW